MNANQIQSEFISLLHQNGEKKDYCCQLWSQGTRQMSRNIIELSGSINCLIYFKVRSEKSYKSYNWGVTANRIDELKQSDMKWILVLLYESASTGYLVTAKDVNRYLSIWPLGSDGDYKVATGKYLQFNKKPFQSFSEFINSLVNSCKWELWQLPITRLSKKFHIFKSIIKINFLKTFSIS